MVPQWVGLGERRLWWQMEMGEHGVKEREAILEHGVLGKQAYDGTLGTLGWKKEGYGGKWSMLG